MFNQGSDYEEYTEHYPSSLQHKPEEIDIKIEQEQNDPITYVRLRDLMKDSRHRYELFLICNVSLYF